MEIMKIITTLQSFDEGYILYKMGSEFATAVTEAVNLLVRQGERITELEEAADREDTPAGDDVRQKIYNLLEGHCALQKYGECTNSKAPDCIWCLADALVKQGVTVEGTDANALFDELLKKQHSDQSMGIVVSFYPQMRAIVVNQPTVDAVEVVRCEHCMYRSQYSDENGMYHCGGIETTEEHAAPVVAPDFACLHGERKR